eukprot:3561663-Rhodomonas_salina.2
MRTGARQEKAQGGIQHFSISNSLQKLCVQFLFVLLNSVVFQNFLGKILGPLQLAHEINGIDRDARRQEDLVQGRVHVDIGERRQQTPHHILDLSFRKLISTIIAQSHRASNTSTVINVTSSATCGHLPVAGEIKVNKGVIHCVEAHGENVLQLPRQP